MFGASLHRRGQKLDTRGVGTAEKSAKIKQEESSTDTKEPPNYEVSQTI